MDILTLDEMDISDQMELEADNRLAGYDDYADLYVDDDDEDDNNPDDYQDDDDDLY